MTQGLANSSGVLGHYLMDHAVGGGAAGDLPGFDPTPFAERAAPRKWHLRDPLPQCRQRPAHPRFIRGYGFQGGASAGINFGAGGFGASYKKAVLAGSYGIDLGAFGESLARFDNYCDIDPGRARCLGHPGIAHPDDAWR